MFIDLHTHSTISDGSYTPTELVDYAAEKDLKVLALTDHDSTDGIDEFMRAAQKYENLIPVPGVEISVSSGSNEIHLVGLFVDHKSESLEKLLCEIRTHRSDRNLKIVDKLQKLGYDITIEEVLEVAGGGIIGRPHFAKVLINKGYFREAQDVFDECLKRGQAGYVHRILPSFSRGIREIHNAGGIAIWAHAVWRRKRERSFVRNTLNKLMRAGVDGIETKYTYFSEQQSKMLKEIAEEYCIIESGGSDFHGTNQPKIDLGTGYEDLKVPFEFYEKMLSNLRSPSA